MLNTSRIIELQIIVLLLFASIQCTDKTTLVSDKREQALQVWKENPWYFMYRGEPVLLLGASDYHNLFQRPDIIEHLDRMQSAGGNYVRNTMASRELLPDHRDLWPYHIVEHTEDPLINIYDLDNFNLEYWERFSRMLEETFKRDIIVEIELWERHDTYRTRDQAGWERHPFNPDNNINYTEEESGMLTGEWVRRQFDRDHPFFNTVPKLNNLELALNYQRKFVDKLLSYTIDYDHILYNMNNETQEHHYFGEYWAEYLLEWAEKNGKHIELTDMQDNHDVTQKPVERVMESDIYTFVDISQNNFQRGELHWERIEYIRNFLMDFPKPITNIKVYGSSLEPQRIPFTGSTDEAVQRYWRNILGGCASVRFHRPPWGIGLNDTAFYNLKSMRMMTDSMDFFNHVPSNHLLSERDDNEAYCMAYAGNEYVIYFPTEGSVYLKADPGTYEVSWLRTCNASWLETYSLELPGRINTPDNDHWAVLIKKR